MLQKKLHLYRDVQKTGVWSDFGTVTSMADATVLVVGLGDIGCHFARLCKAMGAYVIGVKRRPSAKPDCADELYTMEHLDELLPRADVIFSILPGTKEVYHLYNKERFEKMKKTAIWRPFSLCNGTDYSSTFSGNMNISSQTPSSNGSGIPGKS